LSAASFPGADESFLARDAEDDDDGDAGDAVDDCDEDDDEEGKTRSEFFAKNGRGLSPPAPPAAAPAFPAAADGAEELCIAGRLGRRSLGVGADRACGDWPRPDGCDENFDRTISS
jgi:hypothetical protein